MSAHGESIRQKRWRAELEYLNAACLFGAAMGRFSEFMKDLGDVALGLAEVVAEGVMLGVEVAAVIVEVADALGGDSDSE